MKKRILFTFISFTFIATVLGGRAFYIQVIKDERLSQLAKRQFNSKIIISARRGSILDRNGEALAVNTDIFSLAANPSKIQNRAQMSRLLSKALQIPQHKLKEKLKEKRDFTWIKRHLSEEEMSHFKKWGISDRVGNLPEGFWLVKESDRKYPHGSLASHLLGTVNLDGNGVEGIELSQNARLQGKGSTVGAVKDALGRPAFYDSAKMESAHDGEDLELTIDASLQFTVEDELRAAIVKTKSVAGTVIVMDAVSGEILALANAPTFNPNERKTSAENKRNRAITDGYEPGSTLKAIVLATALEKGMKITDQLYGDRGSFTVQGRKISEAETHEKFEWTSLSKMIQVSSNVIAAKLALKLGEASLLKGLQTFGFAKKTGLLFPGELSGWLPPRKTIWQPLTVANVGFGQGIMVTPLQMLRAYASFINGGYLVTPKVLKNAKDVVPPPVKIISEQTASEVLSALEKATSDEGTGKKARLEGYRVAGKTGTAQTVDSKTKKYSRTRYMSSFIGFPLNVQQKIVIFTMLDEPKPIYYASETAAPLFREVLSAVTTRFAIPSTEPMILGQQSDPKKKNTLPQTNAQIHESLTLTQSHAIPTLGLPENIEYLGDGPDGKKVWKMPNLKGVTLTEALDSLSGTSLKIKALGNGTIVEQTPAAGEKVKESELVQLKLSL